MKYQSYSDKLQLPSWQKRRLEVMQRDSWSCRSCGETKIQLQVHHVDYIPGIDPADYPDDMLVTLCQVCHDKERGRDKLETHLATTLKMKGFLLSDLLALSCKIDTDIRFTETLLKALRQDQ
jgi:5-methylcytosine-specific restriction endonuclease McrA